MNQESAPGEIILIDKPLGWTSFQAVKKVKWILGAKKCGHAGTLDPLATGLLILCTEKCTKKINEIQDAEKEYTGTIVLGAITPSYDLETEPEEKRATTEITLDKIEALLPEFRGEIMQAPPLFSAIKVEGKRAYKLARQGVDHKLEKRMVTIRELEIISFENPVLKFRVTCSKGTYIRSLAHDIGQRLGCGGYLSELRRTRIGDYMVENAVLPTEVKKPLLSGNE
ncbi:MAG: tRNA pseudouridine(55) synthase TruB [Bacteroidetes bacterium]|nr:tRNA pseudouridine(55) synthase TruB [Bacteroidota bacterium]